MEKHKIDWLNMPGYKGETWNPIIGCSKVSPACKNCYAEKMAFRLSNIALTKNKPTALDYYVDVIGWGKWNGKTEFVESALDKPLHWKKPRMIFVCSMSDLFHENNSFEDIGRVIDVIQKCPQHIFILLTKRHERMQEYFYYLHETSFYFGDYPIQNIRIGVTVENQEQANKRIPILLDIPAAKHFVSIEPMLSKMYISEYLTVINESGSHDYGGPFSGREKLDWVIVGGESGHNARPMHPDWVRSIRDQCKEANVPYFFKQWGHWIPEDLWQDDYCLDMGKVLYVHDHNENYFPIGTKKSGSELDGHHHKEFPV